MYVYKLTADNGGAPSVDAELLSLAICKPKIRTTAQVGDVIFGFAANSLDPNNHLIYVARISETVDHGRYYRELIYRRREDCIYAYRNGGYRWRPDSLHHGPEHVTRDLGEAPDYKAARVLLSTDFRYFGKTSKIIPESDSPVKAMLAALEQGHRVHHPDVVRRGLDALIERLWSEFHEMKLGEPSERPDRSKSHRGGPCAVFGNGKHELLE